MFAELMELSSLFVYVLINNLSAWTPGFTQSLTVSVMYIFL